MYPTWGELDRRLLIKMGTAGLAALALPGTVHAMMALRSTSPALRWANTRDRGYISVQFTSDAVRSEWHFLDTVRSRSLALKGSQVMTVKHGEGRFAS